MKVVIYGAGISGLTAAFTLHTLAKNKCEIILIEKSDRVGGHIQTIEKEGFLFERGPRAFLSARKGKKTLDLIENLGITNELILANPKSKKRYLWNEQKLQPITPFFLLKLGFFYSCLKELKVPPVVIEESIGAFFLRRFGPKITNTLIDPLVTGIFGGNLWDLSLQAAWPLLKEWENTYHSVTKGFIKNRQKGELLTFRDGMETLPKRLYTYLKERIEIRFSKIQEQNEGDITLFATPNKTLFYQTLTTVNLGWKEKVLQKEGFGYLIPSKEREPILGVTFDSSIFPRCNGTTLCVMLKGENTKALEIALSAIERHLGIKQAPTAYDIHVARCAIPQYQLGHKEKKLEKKDSLIFYTGSSVAGVGVNDCIEHAINSAFDIYKYL